MSFALYKVSVRHAGRQGRKKVTVVEEGGSTRQRTQGVKGRRPTRETAGQREERRGEVTRLKKEGTPQIGEGVAESGRSARPG